jgi:hypothetical protein
MHRQRMTRRQARLINKANGAAVWAAALPPHLQARIERLKTQERSHWHDELYSDEALTNLEYRAALIAAMKATNPRHVPYAPPKPRKDL